MSAVTGTLHWPHSAPTCYICSLLQARAYRIILTHFSTRYPKMPELDLAANPHMAVAMDFMSINLADLQVGRG
jgi:ribonuclease BN (tRNA processing enzyme)